MTREVRLSCEIRVAQLAHQRSADDGLVTETAQLVSSDLATWDIGGWSSWRTCRFQDSGPVQLAELRLRRRRVGNEVAVALEPFEEGSVALSAGQDEQILLQSVLCYICEALDAFLREPYLEKVLALLGF